MNDFEKRWEQGQQRWQERWERRNRHSHIWTGAFILLIGIAALLKAMLVPLPNWVFSWPMLLIALGVFSGLKNNFRNATWFFLILIGGAFLLPSVYPGLEIKRFIWPVVIILIGLAFLFKPRSQWKCDFETGGEKKTKGPDGNKSGFGNVEEATVVNESQNTPEDYIEASTFFGGIDKNIVSKNFKGGKISNVFGGSELNFTQADMTGPATLNFNIVFGGASLIVPSDWAVKSEISPVFGGVEDKRAYNTPANGAEKVLILKGSVVFGGIDIKSY